MVKVTVTKNCASHRFNQDYLTMLILFDGTDNNVRPLGLRGNWQPTDREFRNAVTLLAENSPTFAEWLEEYVLRQMNRWTMKPKTRVITNLAELLL
jgi:hypothetical protein